MDHEEDVSKWEEERAKKAVDDLAADLLSTCWTEEGWTYKTTRLGIRTPNSPIFKVKGIGKVQATMEELHEFFKNVNTAQPTFDPTYIDSKLLHTWDTQGEVTLWNVAYKMPFPIWNRDFVWIQGDLENIGGTESACSVCRSVTSDKCPDRYRVDGLVRGEIQASGQVWKPCKDESGWVDMEYVLQVHPRGWVPAWVMNMVASEQGETVKYIADAFQLKREEEKKKDEEEEEKVEK